MTGQPNCHIVWSLAENGHRFDRVRSISEHPWFETWTVQIY